MLYVGIDEAGYGPLLGPLCVGCCVLRIEGWKEGDPSPDVWAMLKPAVTRGVPKSSGKGAATKIAVDDSKKLKGSNSLKTRHPLMHLERGVIAITECAAAARSSESEAPSSPMIADDVGLFERLGASLDGPWWYSGDATPLPLSTTPDHMRLMRVQLESACSSAGVSILDVRAHAMSETVFNERLREAKGSADEAIVDAAPEARSGGQRSKAAVSFGVVAGFMRRVWKSAACHVGTDAAAVVPRVVIDRQGGRAAYAGVLNRAFPDAIITVLGENPTKSSYELRGIGEADGRSMRVSFQTEAEASHFPVAVASMTAKLVRELAMARFNRAWCARIAELKPTAGYALDGERWLNDVRPHVSPAELASLRRLA